MMGTNSFFSRKERDTHIKGFHSRIVVDWLMYVCASMKRSGCMYMYFGNDFYVEKEDVETMSLISHDFIICN